MRLLFTLDKGDHAACTHSFARHSARSVIIRRGTVAMVHSRKYDYYKFPGGGIEAGEDPVDAMIREAREEAGLTVVPESVREYGYVHRVQKSGRDETERFIQDNFYYLWEAREELAGQRLDDYEAEEAFTPVFVDPAEAIRKNRAAAGPWDRLMFEREARVLELLIEEGYLS